MQGCPPAGETWPSFCRRSNCFYVFFFGGGEITCFDGSGRGIWPGAGRSQPPASRCSFAAHLPPHQAPAGLAGPGGLSRLLLASSRLHGDDLCRGLLGDGDTCDRRRFLFLPPVCTWHSFALSLPPSQAQRPHPHPYPPRHNLIPSLSHLKPLTRRAIHSKGEAGRPWREPGGTHTGVGVRGLGGQWGPVPGIEGGALSVEMGELLCH